MVEGADERARRIAELVGVPTARRVERIQSLWGGYGEAARYALADGRSVVVKHVQPGAGSGRGHRRKLRSYAIERAWYQRWAQRCGEHCRVPPALALEERDGGWLFVLEDLAAAGFPARTPYLSDTKLQACLRWLAAFHATFLGVEADDLWPVGTYWHLATRPDELATMPAGALREAAAAIDARLSGAEHRTLVHGDAKPSNFLFAADGRRVAAVDFQYVGGGCGMKDVAYLLMGETRRETERALDVYFDALREALSATGQAEAVEAEWRALFPWARADLERFMAGWAPGHRPDRLGRELVDEALRAL